MLNEGSWPFIEMWDEIYVYASRVVVSQAVLLAISPAYILKTGQTLISEGTHFYVFILRKQATGKKNISND